MYLSARFWMVCSSALKYCYQRDQTLDANCKRDLTSVVHESILMKGGGSLRWRRRYDCAELAFDIIQVNMRSPRDVTVEMNSEVLITGRAFECGVIK